MNFVYVQNFIIIRLVLYFHIYTSILFFGLTSIVTLGTKSLKEALKLIQHTFFSKSLEHAYVRPILILISLVKALESAKRNLLSHHVFGHRVLHYERVVGAWPFNHH